MLPSSVQDAINGWLCKMLGFLLLLACAGGGISLLTWSAADPSLTHATGAATRNALGPVGAILADLLMQLLGLAGVFTLLPPSFWALQLVTAQRLYRMRNQLLLAPAAILLLAGAAAALPSATTWPLQHGYGGMLGDFGLGLMASALAHFHADRAAAAAGLLYFAAGATVLVASLGLTRQDLKLICQPSGSFRLRDFGGWWRPLALALRHRQQSARAVATPRREPSFCEPPQDPLGAAGAAVREAAVTPPPEDADAFPSGGREAAFDSLTDRASRAIAERFAPAAARRKAGPAPAVTPEPRRAPLPRPARGAAGIDQRGLRAPAWRRPPLGILKRPPAAMPGSEQTEAARRGQARLLGDCLSNLGVPGNVGDIHPGPVVTLFAFEPARGVDAARVMGLADDIARAMRVASVRVALLPGRTGIGIEVPNPRPARLHLRELFECDGFRSPDATLALALGRDISGAPVFADLARMPHLLVAGMSGSGRSVGINAMLLSLIYRLSPDQCRLLMIDAKVLGLSLYNGIPHLLCPVVTDAPRGVAALHWAVAEMQSRYRRMARLGVSNIDVFNNRVRQARKRGELPCPAEADRGAMPHIVIVVDELAELMAVDAKAVEAAVQQLAQMARAAGMHLIIATRRPTLDVVTGAIKASFATRISFKVATRLESRTILDEQGGELLLGHGDMLLRNASNRIVRVQAAYVSRQELEGVADFLREQGAPHDVATGAPQALRDPL